MMGIEFYDNVLTTDDFLQLYKEKENKKIIGMGRLVGDGFMYCYIQDVRVLPQYQNKGIGKTIVEKLIKNARQNGIPNTSISIGLMSAKGK